MGSVPDEIAVGSVDGADLGRDDQYHHAAGEPRLDHRWRVGNVVAEGPGVGDLDYGSRQDIELLGAAVVEKDDAENDVVLVYPEIEPDDRLAGRRDISIVNLEVVAGRGAQVIGSDRRHVVAPRHVLVADRGTPDGAVEPTKFGKL